MERMSGHTIVCGYGRFGSAVIERLPANTAVVVIDSDAARVDEARADGHVAIDGDTTSDETLQEAAIERASLVIVCLSNDAEAISTVLSAKVLNPNAQVVTQVKESGSAAKLRMAGADQVVSPVEMGAQRLVTDSLQPSVGSFLDAALHDETVGLSIRAVVLPESVPFDHNELETSTGIRVIGYHDPDGTIHSISESDGTLRPMQTILVAGHRDELATLDEVLATGA